VVNVWFYRQGTRAALDGLLEVGDHIFSLMAKRPEARAAETSRALWGALSAAPDTCRRAFGLVALVVVCAPVGVVVYARRRSWWWPLPLRRRHKGHPGRHHAIVGRLCSRFRNSRRDMIQDSVFPFCLWYSLARFRTELLSSTPSLPLLFPAVASTPELRASALRISQDMVLDEVTMASRFPPSRTAGDHSGFTVLPLVCR
jgi:hypothetical protein